ncbi:MAG: hypothetical protein MI919_15935 [Holophagales bacterium]|nr:hypothetical protein [Holophagales bacterium]
MSRRKRGSSLGRSAEVVRKSPPVDAATPTEPPSAPEAEPLGRSSVAIDPAIRDQAADAAHYLGRSLADLTEELVAQGLKRLAETEPVERLPPTPRRSSSKADLGGRLHVDLSELPGRRRIPRRRTSLSLPGPLRARLASEAFRLRRSQKDILAEILREGLAKLRRLESERLKDRRFDWPPRPARARGRRWR